MSDKMDELFRIQEEFQRLVLRNEVLDTRRKVELTISYQTYLEHELHEFLGLLPFKNYKKYDWGNLKLEGDNMLEELADTLKFYLNIVNLWGFDSNQLYGEFLRKSKIVEERYRRDFGLEK